MTNPDQEYYTQELEKVIEGDNQKIKIMTDQDETQWISLHRDSIPCLQEFLRKLSL